jgi:hypothetical protein
MDDRFAKMAKKWETKHSEADWMKYMVPQGLEEEEEEDLDE